MWVWVTGANLLRERWVGDMGGARGLGRGRAGGRGGEDPCGKGTKGGGGLRRCPTVRPDSHPSLPAPCSCPCPSLALQAVRPLVRHVAALEPYMLQAEAKQAREQREKPGQGPGRSMAHAVWHGMGEQAGWGWGWAGGTNQGRLWMQIAFTTSCNCM